MTITTALTTWTSARMMGWSRIYAIHLSADTIDGYGCQLITTIGRLYYAARGPHHNDPTEIIYKTTTGNFEDDITACIQRAKANGYRPGQDLLYFLVTSIEDFSPRVFSVPCRGHNYHWIIVDHRRDVNVYRQFDRKVFDDTGNTLKNVCSHNRVYITDRDKVSTTMILYNAMIHDGVGRQWESQNFMIDPVTVRTFAECISNITNEEFGPWSDSVSRIVTPKSLQTKLTYDWFASRAIPRLWLIEVLSSMVVHADSCRTGIGTAYGWLINDSYTDQIQDQLNTFMAGYDAFQNSINPANLPDTIQGFDNLTAYQLWPPSEDVQYRHVAHIYAKEWLRTHPEADVLIIQESMLDAIKYALYSQHTDVNCAEIAKLNGGYGDPKVASFLKTIDLTDTI